MIFATGWKNRKQTKAAQVVDLTDYPIREYVASMAAELAILARSDGDLGLAKALEGAARMARSQTGTAA